MWRSIIFVFPLDRQSRGDGQEVSWLRSPTCHWCLVSGVWCQGWTAAAHVATLSPTLQVTTATTASPQQVSSIPTISCLLLDCLTMHLTAEDNLSAWIKSSFFYKPRTTKAFPSYKIEFQCILVSCMHPFYFVYFQNTKLLFPAASHPAGAYLAETGKSSGAGKRCGPRRVLNLHINIGTCGAEPSSRPT